ncbi:VanZ family protein [Tenacibaculum sp. IB213877]|uniref:VanZ family protein n=1 Tax=Tenacibaculum sp. IB213877 TaxID=3097351 RepID=UPI002A5AC846|nr:VanZ family protein [Tenacibaculum sp. IB213877]MDY0781296.1 VanZ family protein [Tenacibaculum sp. IB213877]
MLKLIKNLLKHNSLLIAIAVTIAIAILSLIKIGKMPVHFTYIDKVEHTIAYFVLTFFWLLAQGKTSAARIKVVLICIVYGIIIEVLQKELTTYRSFDYADMLANSAGTIIALLIFSFFLKKRNVFED